nr:LCP family protein [Streptomyces hoynatensis]
MSAAGSPAASPGTEEAGPPGRAAARRAGTRRRAIPGQRDRRASGSRRKPSRKAKKKYGRTRKALMWIGGTLSLLLVVGCAGAWYLYQRLNGNLTKVDVGIENEYGDGDPVNILFIGTDTRTGEGNDSYGGEASEGNDTTILMHFSADRKHATGLSIPRDLITDIPDCEVKREDGSTEVIPGEQHVRFNRSMGYEGRDPGCVWRTVQQLTGVEINHFIMADFNAVKELSTAVDGVPVCIEEPIHDEKTGFDADTPGTYTLEGEDALAFVRTRHSVGTGSDLSRIELQKQFLASLARRITEGGYLSSPTKLYDLADIATRSLTVDSGIGSLNDLRHVAQDLGQVPMSDMNFLTLPVVDNPDEPPDRRATVVIDEDRAAPIFEMLQQDTDPAAASQEGRGEDGANAEEQERAAPEDVRVDVYNGGDVFGAAQDTLEWLQNEEGMRLATNKGNAPHAQETTTLQYGANQADQAATLADVMGLPDSALEQRAEDAGEREPMVLILGNDFRAAGEPIEVPAAIPDDVETITADDEDVCAS